MSDYIRREDITKMCGDWYVEEGSEEGFIGTVSQMLNMFSPADVVQVETLKAEIYKLKCQQDCKNQDYYTGYMSALSTVEGILAEMREE